MLTSARATTALKLRTPAGSRPFAQAQGFKGRRSTVSCAALTWTTSRRDLLFASLASVAALNLPAPAAFAAAETVIPSVTSSPRGFLDVIVTFVPPAQQQLRELLERRSFVEAAQAVAPRAPSDFQKAGEAIALGFDDVANSAAGLVGSLEPLGKQKVAQVQAAYDNFRGKTEEFRKLCLDTADTAGSKAEAAVEVRQAALDAMFEALDGLVDTANTILTQPDLKTA